MIGAVLRADGQPVEIGGIEKMSKSKNNGVDPQAMVDKYGADTVRLFSCSPRRRSSRWSGTRPAWRAWRGSCAALWAQCRSTSPAARSRRSDRGALSARAEALRRQVHETIEKVTDDIGHRHSFNTAIAAVMELLERAGQVRRPLSRRGARGAAGGAGDRRCSLLITVTPHAATRCGRRSATRETRSRTWRSRRSTRGARCAIRSTLVVQVNGKLRGRVTVASDAGADTVREAALADANVQRFMEGRPVRKFVYVPGKLANIVV